MKKNELGRTGIQVSEICLGTMTYGQQNAEEEAHEQLDYALEQGVNFIDTAEMYPVPAKSKTYGFTEDYIGTWLEKRKNRDKIILATKACGPGVYHIRKSPKYTKEHLTAALNDSLRRLKTDYIDLYQLHWPERKSNYFGRLGFVHQPNDPWKDNFLEVLQTLDDFIAEGKIRHIGISNETPWGAMHFLSVAERYALPRIASVQNPYNLLNRTFEIGLSEISHRENVGLLAYSPLAFGVLSGKYFKGENTEKSRLTLMGNQFPRYSSELAQSAAKKYCDLAEANGMTPAQMALAYVTSRSFVTSNIVGATTLEQLKENIASVEVKLSEELLSAIEKIHTTTPNPAP
ncbi:MAG: NADP(H)-dependent aldo-keto reductase [Bacteroidales bacterium]|nr:NADP(H)-dependent aldo-keto reductase [Bacteroidales bacterium]